jgi:hypothetical protein
LTPEGSTPVVNSFEKGEKRDEQWERNSEREYVLRYLYLTHSLIGAFDPERRSNIHDSSVKRRDSALFTAGVSSSIAVCVRFLGKIDGYAT